MRAAIPAGAIVLIVLARPVAAQTDYELTDDGGWVAAEAPEPGSDRALLAQVRQLLADEQPTRARSLINEWIEDHKHTDSPYLPEAYLLRADSRAAAGNEFQALYDYEHVINAFPASEEFVRAVEREFDIAVRYVNGLKRKFLGFRVFGAQDIGEELLIRTAERLPDSHAAEQAILELGDYYYRKHDMKMAAEAYDILLLRFPESRHARQAMLRRIYANIARFKGPAYDASGLEDAEQLIIQFNNRFPHDPDEIARNEALLARIDESQAAQLLRTAQWYLRRGDPVSAKFMIRRLRREHPNTVAAGRGLQIMLSNGWITSEQPADQAPAEGESLPRQDAEHQP